MRLASILFGSCFWLTLFATDADPLAQRKALEARLKTAQAALPASAGPALENLKARADAYFELAIKVKNYPYVGSMSYSTLVSEDLVKLENEMATQFEAMGSVASAKVSKADAQSADLAVTRAYADALARCQAAEKGWKKKGRDIRFGRDCREVTTMHRARIAYREAWIKLHREVTPSADAKALGWAVTAEMAKAQTKFLTELVFK